MLWYKELSSGKFCALYIFRDLQFGTTKRKLSYSDLAIATCTTKYQCKTNGGFLGWFGRYLCFQESYQGIHGFALVKGKNLKRLEGQSKVYRSFGGVCLF